MASHGYGEYTHGCRCEICRQAKSEYMRDRRENARRAAQMHTSTASGRRGNGSNAFAIGSSRHIAGIDSHGTRYGYEEAGCRCPECTAAHSNSHTKSRKE